MGVYFAPSDKTNLFHIRITVDVGSVAESIENRGVSHLLEHLLFRDKSLGPDNTYLQLIREANGDANGTTDSYKTNFFASIPFEKGPWLREQFYKMIVRDTDQFEADFVEKEKDTVLREIGEPYEINRWLGFDLFSSIKLEYLQRPSFWEHHFGIKTSQSHSTENERLSTLRLTPEQVTDRYRDYYYPRNARIYFSGQFDSKETREWLDKTFASWPDRKGLKNPELETPNPINKPLIETSVSDDDPGILRGTKMWDVQLLDEVVVDSYMEYLAHRLMKEIRNKWGSTYHVAAETNIYEKRYGLSTISMKIKKNHFKNGKNLLEEYLLDEAENGKISDAEIAEAIQLYNGQLEQLDSDANTLMNLAIAKHSNFIQYKTHESPYMLLAQVKPDQYRDILKKHFQPNRRYISTSESPLGFKNDYLLLYLIVFSLAYRRYRRFLTQKFDHTQIQWVRKIKIMPLKIYEVGLTLIGLFVIAHINWLAEFLTDLLPILQSHIAIETYIFGSLQIMIWAVVFQSVYSLAPRKLILSNNKLYIKSMTYYSNVIPLDDIKSVKAAHMFQRRFDFWWRLKWRFYFQDWMFWKKALIVERNDGRLYLFSFKNSSIVACELQGFLKKDAVIFPLPHAANNVSGQSTGT